MRATTRPLPLPLAHFCATRTRLSFPHPSIDLGSECGKARGLLAFLWITWLLFTFLLGALLAFALRESTKGRKDVRPPFFSFASGSREALG